MAGELQVSLMLTCISLFLFYIPSPPPFTVSLPSLQCQVSYFCIRGGELSVCLCVRANFYLMCYPLCVWKYTVREVSCECEWALLRSGRTYLPCYVMDPTAICIRYGGDVIWSSELHFNDGWLLQSGHTQNKLIHFTSFWSNLFFFFPSELSLIHSVNDNSGLLEVGLTFQDLEWKLSWR